MTIVMHRNRVALETYCVFAMQVRSYVLKAYNKHRPILHKYSLKNGELTLKNNTVAPADVELMALFSDAEAKSIIHDAFSTRFCGNYDGEFCSLITPDDLDAAMRAILAVNFEAKLEKLKNDPDGVDAERALEKDVAVLGEGQKSMLPSVLLYCLQEIGAMDYYKFKELLKPSFDLK